VIIYLFFEVVHLMMLTCRIECCLWFCPAPPVLLGSGSIREVRCLRTEGCSQACSVDTSGKNYPPRYFQSWHLNINTSLAEGEEKKIFPAERKFSEVLSFYV
jgi:hypothetical protein